ncbi:hypothetical protein V1264_017379 [Littorina saxatilis]|uniref:Ig-like domain-containing protein n=2 Tax=Littorina saxatilis TaxID=31220 RepID=A0AAN9GFC0_9CAEN
MAVLLGKLHLISSENCVTFQLTNTPNITKETPSFTLTFHIINTCDSEIFMVKLLGKSEAAQNVFDTLCQMIHTDGTCISSRGCTCSEASREYSVTGRIRGVTDEWALSVKLQNGVSFQQLIEIGQKKSPPRIESIMFHSGGKPVSSPVSQNSSVTVVCTWDSGYPPMTTLPRLINPSGQDIGVTHIPNGVNTIQHIMHNVQCEDAGEYVCEADSGTSRKSDSLLVKCAPSFAGVKNREFRVAPGGNLYLRLPVRSHSVSLEQCELKEVLPDFILTFKSCQSSDRSLHLIGSPPDMTLLLNLSNVTSKSHGTWTLGLGNDVGVGYLTFSVNVTSDISMETSSPVFEGETKEITTDFLAKLSDTTTQTPSLGIIVGVVGGLLLFVIVVVVVVCLLVKRRGTALPPPAPHTFRRVARAEGNVDVVFHVEPASDENDGSQQNVHNHIYSEIPDDETDEASDDSASPEPESEASSSDYLNPTASSAERTAPTQTSVSVEVTATIHATEASTNEDNPSKKLNHEEQTAEEHVKEDDSDESKAPEENARAEGEEAESFGVHSSGARAEPPYENTVDLLIQ